ncbi:MAG: NAD(P)/FAD-dependent oxidoreductase [Phenylobacterium sp.]|nr:MAG: NAD(P)/FAD-dependent oxidoreductase [Phenylobacterium sp.]
MPVDVALLDEALAVAHLPALCGALVHVTGDESWIRPEWTPVYVPLSRGETGLPPEVEADIRARAKAAITEFLAGDGKLPPAPPVAVVRRIMDFVAGAEIPEAYADFAMDELAIAGQSSKDPQFDQPRLQAAARKLKVLVIGAGMSGILAGIRLSQAGVPFEIIDKNPDVGGTWFENTYPGCRVDNANHMYSYSFEPNHAWPQHFSPQPELLKYFRGVVERHGLRRHIRFETLVEACAWDDAKGVWRVTLKDRDGRSEVVEANAVISAVGQLNRPRYPDVEGRETFEGPSFHSAEWRHDVDLKGKRVAVIGTGASAFQFVPEIAPEVGQMTVFMRNPPWGLPVAHYHESVPEGFKWLLEHVPYYDKWYRFYLFWTTTEGFLPMVKSDPLWNGGPGAVSEVNAGLREMVGQYLSAQVADRADLVDKVVPGYPIGGKRAVLDNGVWLGALKRENVRLVTDKLEKITSKGVVAGGVEHEVDVIIYGTGFQASNFLSFYKVTGKGGRELHDVWAGDARAYLGMTVPDFPNFFMIYGPNTNIVVNGSIIFFSECAVRYIVGCLRMLGETGAAAMEVRKDVHDAFNAKVDEANKGWAWGSPHVTSWYKNSFGRVSQNWPFGLIDYWRATLAPNPDDFVLERQTEPVA